MIKILILLSLIIISINGHFVPFKKGSNCFTNYIDLQNDYHSVKTDDDRLACSMAKGQNCEMANKPCYFNNQDVLFFNSKLINNNGFMDVVSSQSRNLIETTKFSVGSINVIVKNEGYCLSFPTSDFNMHELELNHNKDNIRQFEAYIIHNVVYTNTNKFKKNGIIDQLREMTTKLNLHAYLLPTDGFVNVIKLSDGYYVQGSKESNIITTDMAGCCLIIEKISNEHQSSSSSSSSINPLPDQSDTNLIKITHSHNCKDLPSRYNKDTLIIWPQTSGDRGFTVVMDLDNQINLNIGKFSDEEEGEFMSRNLQFLLSNGYLSEEDKLVDKTKSWLNLISCSRVSIS